MLHTQMLDGVESENTYGKVLSNPVSAFPGEGEGCHALHRIKLNTVLSFVYTPMRFPLERMARVIG